MPPVIDANVLIHGRGKYQFDTAYTVPEVMEEMKSSGAKLKFDTNEIDVQEPSGQSLKRVQEKADEINADTSEADERLVALALELEEQVITDDKGVQNLALHLEVEFRPFMREPIEEKRRWITVCENCGAEVSGDECNRCGSSQLRRKPGQCS